MRNLLIVVTAFSCLTSRALSAETASHVPPEFFLAETPDLPLTGPARVSWGFLRAPRLWAQGQVYSLEPKSYPQWTRDHSPAFLAPVPGRPTTLEIFDESRSKISDVLLDHPFIPEVYEKSAARPPAFYRLKIRSESGRFTITTEYYPWIRRKDVLHCSATLDEESPIDRSQRVQGCLQGLQGIADSRERQWFTHIVWPKSRSREETQFIGAQERQLKAAFRKSGHFYESERGKTREFKVTTGTTENEKLPAIAFNPKDWPRTEFITTAPSREERERVVFRSERPNGEELEIRAFAADTVNEREVKSGPLLDPPIEIQFVEGHGKEPVLRTTEFREGRSGVEGALRPWEAVVFGGRNQISSNRGERDEFLGLPGFRLTYKSDWWNLTPSVRYETGAIHTGSTLAISDLQATVRHSLGDTPIEISGGLEQYTLSGKNPGTARLGKMNAGAIGLFTQRRIENTMLRGSAHLLVSTPSGYDSEFEAGRFFMVRGTELYAGVYVGFARYAARVDNLLGNGEDFSEDRIKYGVSFGWIGADYFGR